MAKTWSGRHVGLLACLLSSLLFLMFQGGKVAFMIFSMVFILTAYLFLGRWSGIAHTKGRREFVGSVPGGEVEAGTALQVRLRFHIPGYWPIPYVIVRDRLVKRNGREQKFESSFVPDWRRRGEIVYKTPPLRRGIYTFEETTCITEDIFGFFRHRGTLDLRKSLRVIPKTVHIREWKHFRQMYKGVFHSAATRSLRETTEISGVREYVYGDRISRIHWNASARTGTWKSKEFERESLPKMVIVLDGERAAYGHDALFELGVSVTASLLRFGEQANLAQGLLTTGKNITFFEPRRDFPHQQKLMNHLVEIEADGEKSLIQSIREGMPSGNMFLILISPRRPGELADFLHRIQTSKGNGCHIWLDPLSTAGNDSGSRTGMKTYRIHTLEQLPLVLEGRE